MMVTQSAVLGMHTEGSTKDGVHSIGSDQSEHSQLIDWHRFLPETLALLYWGVSGDLVNALLLPSLFRAILLGSVLFHGLGHALAGAGGGCSAALHAYLDRLSARSLLPFSPIFLPGLSALEHTPEMPVQALGRVKGRLAAIAGPMSNLLVMILALLWLDDTKSAQGLGGDILKILVGVNAWILLTSWSDYASLLTGRMQQLYCGNFGILAARNKSDRGFLPKRFERLTRHLGESTDIRGQQAGGIAVLASGGHFVGSKVINDKRGNLTHTLLRSFQTRARLKCVAGSRPLQDIFHMVAHYRYGTSSSPSLVETHWHQWSQPRKTRVWQVDGSHLVQRRQAVSNLITHNGDFDAWAAPTGRMGYVELGQWLTEVLQAGNAAIGDSAKIAGMMDLLNTQGQWDASVRLSYALQTGSQLSTAAFRAVCSVFEKTFSDWLVASSQLEPGDPARLVSLGCPSLTQVFERNSTAIRKLQYQLQQALFPVTKDWPDALKRRRRRFIGQAVQAFFCNDLSEAVRLFMDRAEGTFGLVATTSLQPGAIVLAAERQPLYIGTDPDQRLFAYASEAAALKLSCSESQCETTPVLPFRFELSDGDIVLLQVFGETADNSMTVLNRYSDRPPVVSRITRDALLESANDKNRGGWVLLTDNPYMRNWQHQGEDRVKAEMQDIPLVLSRIQNDWEEPGSLNRLSARSFCRHLFANARSCPSQDKNEGAVCSSTELELLVLGVENSHYLATRFVEDLRVVFPNLRCESVDAVSYCERPEQYPLGPNTITLAISHSGQTFNTVDAVKFIQSLYDIGRAGPVFVMTGETDTQIGSTVGQSFKREANWCRRIFITGAGGRTAEPATCSSVAIHATLTQLLIRLIREGREILKTGVSPFGLAADENDALQLEGMARYTVSRASALLGRTAEGWQVETEEQKSLCEEGRYISQLLIEPAVVFIATALHLFLMLWLGWNPVIGIQTELQSLSGSTAFSDQNPLANLVLAIGQTAYFLFSGIVFTLMLRKVQGRPLWDRLFAGRTLIIGDEPMIKSLLLQYISKLFAQAYEFCGFASLHAADTRSGELIHMYAHRITRGLLLYIGMPDGRCRDQKRAEASIQMTCSQARSVQNLGAGATVTGVGHNPLSARSVDRYLLLGNARHKTVVSPWEFPGAGSELFRQLRETRFVSLERLLAGYVVFHAAAARTRDFTNALVPIANLFWMPVFLPIRLLTRGRVNPRFGYWDLARTQSGTLIATTAAPVPAIAMTANQYQTPSMRLGRLKALNKSSGSEAVTRATEPQLQAV